MGGEPLLPTDMMKYMSYGGKDIKLTDGEVGYIRSFGEVDS